MNHGIKLQSICQSLEIVFEREYERLWIGIEL